MNAECVRRVRAIKLVLVAACAVTYVALASARAFVQSPPNTKQRTGARRAEEERFDPMVRDDFFAGLMGDDARLDAGMKLCEDVLAKNPRHAEALVWHGGGLLTRAAHAYTKGDSKLGDQLWERGLKEMDDAVAFEPDNMGVKIGRSATIIGLAQSGFDASDPRGRALLTSAVADYEKVYRWQRPSFQKLGVHSRGELLFGLACGWSILGEHEKARAYLRLALDECRGSVYEAEARKWLAAPAKATVQHDCTGCHVRDSY